MQIISTRVSGLMDIGDDAKNCILDESKSDGKDGVVVVRLQERMVSFGVAVSMILLALS